MNKRKTKFEGAFNWFGEVYVFYRYASPNTAFQILTKALSQKLGISFYLVRNHFDGKKDNYQIREIE